MLRAISLTQPWASLMAIGVKRNETRSWANNYKGDIAICATKEFWRDRVPDYASNALVWLWVHRDKFPPANDVQELYNHLPFGKVVCVVEKTGCISTNDDNGDDRSLNAMELELGDYSRNRFYYPTQNCRRLTTPIAVRGAQGLFSLPPDVEALVRAQLP